MHRRFRQHKPFDQYADFELQRMIIQVTDSPEAKLTKWEEGFLKSLVQDHHWKYTDRQKEYLFPILRRNEHLIDFKAVEKKAWTKE